MKSREQIRAIFFLSIFSMFVLHQALPHVHHQHYGLEDSIGHKEQDHKHEKVHHHEDDKDNSDFLDFLFGNHSHGTHAENTPTVKSNTKPSITDKDIPECAIILSQEFSITKTELENTIFGKQPPDYSYNTYLFTSLLRGPPSLG